MKFVVAKWLVRSIGWGFKFLNLLIKTVFTSNDNAGTSNTWQMFIKTKILQTRPVWPPGTKVGYHVLTYGWLIDQIVRRVDVKNRGVVDFFKEEIYPLAAGKHF